MRTELRGGTWDLIRRPLFSFSIRWASASKPQVSMEAGIATMATEKTAVITTMRRVYQGRSPSGSPCAVSISTDRYIQEGMDAKSSLSSGRR